MIYHFNLQKGDISHYIKQFQNHLETLKQNTKRVQLYHFILSWTEEDRDKINASIMRKAIRKFIGLHSQARGVYLAVGHGADTPHPHCHILCPGLEAGSKNKALRISKARFSEIQQELQLWEKQYFPELRASRIYYGEKERQEKNTKHTEHAIKKRKRISKKQMLATRIQQIAVQARSEESLLTSLKKEGINPYFRNHTLAGFKDPNSNRKYRVKTLGLEKALESVHNKTKKSVENKQAVHRKTKKVSHKTNEGQRTEHQHPQYKDILKELEDIRTITEGRENDTEIER